MSSIRPIVPIKEIKGPVVFSKVEALNEFAKELVKKGYTVVSPSTPDTYITVVHPSDKFAYIQQNAHYNIGGKFDFSRQYVPSRENGSALQVIGNAELTINNLQRVFSVSLISTVSLYSSLDMFLKQQTWQDLSVVSPAGKFHYPKNSYGTIG